MAGGPLAICGPDEAEQIHQFTRGFVALYVGGMGAKGKNFYNDIFRSCGYEDAARQIQNLYLDGKKEEAMAAVPQDFLDATSMVGDEGFVRERIEAYRDSGVTMLNLQPFGPDQLDLIERVRTWIS